MSNFFKFIIPIILIILGIQFTRDFFGGRVEDEVKNLRELITNGVKTHATLQNEYKIQTIKILGVPTKYYDYKYAFIVNGSVIQGKYTFDKEQTDNDIEIIYLPKNPEINSVNPKDRIKFLESGKNNNIVLIIGLILIFLGVFIGYSKYKNIRNSNNTN